MPRVALTDAQRLANKAADGDKALNTALKHYKIDNDLRWDDVADRLSVSRSSLSRWRPDPGDISLRVLRKIISVTRMTPEDWLKIGGF